MAASTSTRPLWAILGRVALVEHDSVEDPGDLELELAMPLRVSTLTVPMSLHPKPRYDDTDKHPYVVAAADARLLLHVSHWPFVGFDLDDRPPDILLVASTDTAVARVPDRAPGQPGIANIRNLGLASLPSSGGADYVVAELRLVDDDTATLLTFRSGTGAWAETDLACPSMYGRRGMWSSHDVVAHHGRLWWVNLVWGFLGCDPFADEPVLRHVRLPPPFADNRKAVEPPTIESSRMVRVSQGRLRYVFIVRDVVDPVEETLVVVTSLEFDPSGEPWWARQSANSLGVIWASESYRESGMPAEVPVLALVHPSNPDVVYFFLEKYLFGVNLAQSRVTEFVREPNLVTVVAGPRPPPPISWRYVLAWELPPSHANVSDDLMDEDEASVEGSVSSSATAISDLDASPDFDD